MQKVSARRMKEFPFGTHQRRGRICFGYRMAVYTTAAWIDGTSAGAKAEKEGQRMTEAGTNAENGTEILPEKAAAFWMNGQIRRIRAGAVMPAVKA